MKIRKTVGIDLGTTNSVIALLDAVDAALISGQDEQGRLTFPSVVGWHPQMNRRVAGRAPDEDHPYGHDKFETLGAIGIVGFLSISCFELLREGISTLASGSR